MSRQPYTCDWEQPFSPEEYRARRAKVSAALQAQGLDGILLTNPADIYYLTGYDMIWYHLRCMTSCFVRAEDGATTFFDSPAHRTMVETTPEITDVAWLSRFVPKDNAGEIADALAERGMNDRKIGMQFWGYSPHHDTLRMVETAFKARGMTVSDASSLVEHIRLYKSDEEVAVIRQAAAIADQAMTAARNIIAPGVMETEIQAEIMATMMRAGGGDPSIRTMVGSGTRAGTHHSPAQHRRVGNDELVFVDFCGCLHRYHVNLNRTFALGEVDHRWYDLMERASATIDAIVEQTGPGDLLSKVQKVGDAATDANGLRENVWFIGGYSLGISMPPDWVGEIWVDPRAGAPDFEMKPGMVFNFEGQFDDTENWAGGSGVAYIDSLLVTETGLEVLSSLPRTLVKV